MSNSVSSPHGTWFVHAQRRTKLGSDTELRQGPARFWWLWGVRCKEDTQSGHSREAPALLAVFFFWKKKKKVLWKAGKADNEICFWLDACLFDDVHLNNEHRFFAASAVVKTSKRVRSGWMGVAVSRAVCHRDGLGELQHRCMDVWPGTKIWDDGSRDRTCCLRTEKSRVVIDSNSPWSSITGGRRKSFPGLVWCHRPQQQQQLLFSLDFPCFYL